MAEFRRGQQESKSTPDLGGLEDAQLCFHTFVADTDAEARRLAEAPFDLYVETRLYAKRAVYADIMKNGLHLMGSVETVADKLVALAEMGVGHVMTMHDFGAMPAAAVERSMRLLAEEVLPRVRRGTRG